MLVDVVGTIPVGSDSLTLGNNIGTSDAFSNMLFFFDVTPIILILNRFEIFAHEKKQLLLYNLVDLLHNSSAHVIIIGVTKNVKGTRANVEGKRLRKIAKKLVKIAKRTKNLTNFISCCYEILC